MVQATLTNSWKSADAAAGACLGNPAGAASILTQELTMYNLRGLLLMVQLLVVNGDAVVNATGGSSACPCLSAADVSRRFTALLNDDGTLPINGYNYPAGYGVGCAKHDAELQPFCVDESGDAVPEPPRWCHESWCYVDG